MDVPYKKKRMIVIAIAVLILMVYFIPLGCHGLLEPDEGRYSEIPREMIESGDFITPRLNYVKYFEKPVLLYWMNAASFMAFGENEFAARFPTALSGILGALATALLCAAIFGRRAGAIAGAVTALSLLYFAIGTITLTDMPLSFFLTAALSAFYYGHIKGDRRWFLIFYASVALGLLTKGLIAIVLPGGIIFWYIVFTKKWRLIVDALYLPGIALFFIIAFPWFYMVSRENPDFLYFFFIREHFLRYATKIHNRYEPFWFFLPMIPVGLMPWTGFFFSLFSKESILRSPEDKKIKDANIYMLSWFTVILVFFSISSSKLIPYIVPCFPPLAILIASDIDRMIERRKWHGKALVLSAVTGGLFSVALVVYTFIGGRVNPHETLPYALAISAGLLAGPTAAMFIAKKGSKAAYEKAVAALCISAAVYIAAHYGIYDIMGKTRSTKGISEVIMKERLPNETIAVYGEILQGIPFYTKQRVLLINSMGELEFGAKKPEGKGWFPDSHEFLPEWKSKDREFVLVIEKDRLKNLFRDGKTLETKKIEYDDYLILFNRRLKENEK
ncbi:MAG: glycosyltransferase family 39 protein [Synergistaceae bacterium]|nr:glycosyltransferase family 39 protein [Synergistaceae bacterium]